MRLLAVSGFSWTNNWAVWSPFAFFAENIGMVDPYLIKRDMGVVGRHIECPHELFYFEPCGVCGDNKAGDSSAFTPVLLMFVAKM
ncbi:MAG: hypothetical protein ACJ0F6_01375 [Acidimicrobiales bacterium]